MLKSYNIILEQDVLTLVCEPETDKELCVNSMSIFGGANGGYIDIHIGNFIMKHSVAANDKLTFPFIMAVPNNSSIKAISTNAGLFVSVSAEQFDYDSYEPSPTPPSPDEPEIDYASMPLTITALEETGIVLNKTPNNNDSKNYDFEYKLNNGSWKKLSFGQTILLNKEDFVQFRNNYNCFTLDADEPISFNIKGKSNISGLLRSLVNYSKEISPYCFNRIFNKTDIVSAKNLILDFDRYPEFSFFYAFGECPYLEEGPAIPEGEKVTNCFASLFAGSVNLKEIKVNFSNWQDDTGDSTANWVNNVATEGTFYKPSALPEEYEINRIPVGWTVVNID